MDCMDGLEYRGEGNCAIVFANTKTRQVYRLVKKDYTKNYPTKLAVSHNRGECLSSQNVDSDVRSKLEDAINYVTNIMDPLLSFNYAVIPELISVPSGFGDEAVKQVDSLRPVHRRKSCRDQVDSDVYTGLVLSDCCFIRPVKSTCGAILSRISQDLSSNLEDSDCSKKDVCASINTPGQIKHNSYLNKSKCDGSICNVISTTPTKGDKFFYEEYLFNSVDSCPALRLQVRSCDVYNKTTGEIHGHRINHKDAVIPDILEQKLNYRTRCSLSPSSSPDSSCVHLPGNISMDHSMSFLTPNSKGSSSFTLSIEVKPKKGFKTVCQKKEFSDDVCRFCMHKYLKTKCGKWPETSSYCPLDLFSGDKKRMKHALVSLIKTPQNNLKICKNGCEIYGSDIREDLPEVLQTWFPHCKEKKPRLISTFINLIIEILLRVPQGEATPEAKEISSRRSHVLETTVQTCSSSSYVHSDKECQPGLPTGCVLERIQSIQALDTLDIAGIFPLYSHLKHRMEADATLRNKWCLDGPFSDVSWLGIGRNSTDSPHSEFDEYAVFKLKQFLVSKTLQDCSIITAIQPVSERPVGEGYDCLWFEGHLYQYSISLVDLEPKSFDKVKTYFKQASDIAHSFAASKE